MTSHWLTWTAAIKMFSMTDSGLKGSSEGKLDSTAAFVNASFPGNVYANEITLSRIHI